MCDLSAAAASARALDPRLVGRIDDISDLRSEPEICSEGPSGLLSLTTIDVGVAVCRFTFEELAFDRWSAGAEADDF